MTTTTHAPELTATFERLRAGQRWLVDTYAELYRLPNAGIGTALEAKFVIGLHWWADLDDRLRSVHGYQDCARGTGSQCLDGSPVVCQRCAQGDPVQLGMKVAS